MALTWPSRAEPPSQLLCTNAIELAKRSAPLPPRLLEAVAQVESGRLDPASGRWRPWPWTINVEGEGHYFDTASDAIAFVKDLQARGVRSIDVGCMQVNLLYHPAAFASVEEAFDPRANVRYAARFLLTLYRATGDWPTAVGLYHSATPELSASYRARVLGEPPAPVITEADRRKAALILAWRATLSHEDSHGASPGIVGARSGPAPRIVRVREAWLAVTAH